MPRTHDFVSLTTWTLRCSNNRNTNQNSKARFQFDKFVIGDDERPVLQTIRVGIVQSKKRYNSFVFSSAVSFGIT